MVNQSPIVAVQRSAVPLDTPEFALGNQALGHLFKAQEQPNGSGLRSHHLASGGVAPGRPLFQGLSQELPLQAKLTLTQAGDRHEHEADRVAARVVQRLQTPTTASGSGSPSVMPKLLSVPSGNQGGAIAPPLETAIKQQQGKGNPIAEDIREPLEQAFGVDFSHVKIHTDGTSDQLNCSISALAFTTGKDIFFKQGAYQPRSPKGQALLAHELTHVVQQNQPLKTVQRKVDTPQKPQPAQTVEIIDLLPEISREIQAFSPNWLDSDPSKIELCPWLKVVKPSINVQQDSNHRNLDIQGGIELNLGTGAIAVQPKGTLKLSYKSQTKQWDYKSENIGISATIGDILKFDAQDITYDRTQKSFNIAKAGITIPNLNNADASVTKAKIDAQGLAWEKVDLNVKNIALGNYAKINNASAEIAGAAAQYKSQFKGDFDVTLGSSDSVQVQGNGQLTIDYDNGVWSCPQNNVTLSGAIANILKFNAKDIHYDHKAQIVTIQQSTVRVPKGKNSTEDYFKADVTQAKIDQTGLDWNIIKLNANDIPLLGEYVTLKQATGEIQGASKQYNSNFEGDFNVNFGSSDLVQVDGSGHLTFNYIDGKVTVEHKDVGLNGTIANILKFNAKDIHYDHKTNVVTIQQSTVRVPKGKNSTEDYFKADVTQAKIDQTGLDWNTIKLNANDIPLLGEYVTLKQATGEIQGASKQYNSNFEGDFNVNFGSSDLVQVDGSGHLTFNYIDGKVTVEHKDVGLNGTIANILKFNAKDIHYDHKTNVVTIQQSTVRVPNNADKSKDYFKTDVTQAKIDQTGLDWNTIKLNANDIPLLGEYVTLKQATGEIQGASKQYNSNFGGDFNVNFGSSDLVQVQGSGHLSFDYKNGKVSIEHKDVGLDGTIANILKFNAKDIHYDHKAQIVTIQQSTVRVPKGKNSTKDYFKADVTQAKIDQTGLDWNTIKLNANDIPLLGEYVTLKQATGEIQGASKQYNSNFEGDFNVNFGSSDLVQVDGSGHLTFNYIDGKVTVEHKDVGLNGTIANILKFNAKDIHYDHKTNVVTIQQSTVRVPKGKNSTEDYFKADVTQAKIDQTGLDWNTIDLKANQIPLLGSYVSLETATGTIAGAAQKYKSNFEGDFKVDLGSSDLVEVKGRGSLAFDYENGNVTVEHKNVGLNGKIAKVLEFNASDIHYDHENPKVTIGKAGISIPSLNQASASVENARLDKDGVDWDVAKATIATIPIGDIFTITNPAVLVEGRQQEYSTTASGGVKLKLGKYFTAEGKGAVTLAKKDAESKRNLRVDSLDLSAKGDIQFPGDSMNWPLDLAFNYPIIPGAVEAGISLTVKGSLGASLSGTVKKESKEKYWDVAANPEIKGAIGIALKGNASVGTVYAAALNAFIEGGCKVEAKGGLKIDGKLGYDEESKKVDAKGLKSEYYAGAEFKITMGAGVQAKALYIFTKDLYAIRGELSLGRGSMKGNLEFDENGGLKIGKPTFEGCLSFELDKKSIDFKRTHDVVNADKAKQLLENAQQYIPGSGKERKRIIDHVKAEYIKVFDQAKKVIENETSKNEKYVQKLERLSVKVSRYQELLDLSGELFDKDQELVDLKSESKITPEIEKQAEEIEQKEQKKTSDSQGSFLNKVKDTAEKAITKVKQIVNVKEKIKEKFKKHVPPKVWDKYYALKEEKDEIKEKAKHAKDMLTIKLHDAEQKVASISNIKTELKGKVSELKSKALQTKREMTEKVKSKALLKITEFGIQDPKSFIKRMEQLAQMQEKYTQKYEKHSEILENALKAKEQSDGILKNVKEAIGWDDEKLELGEGLNTISDMRNNQSDLESVEKELSKEIIKLDDNLDQELAKL